MSTEEENNKCKEKEKGINTASGKFLQEHITS